MKGVVISLAVARVEDDAVARHVLGLSPIHFRFG